MVRLDSSGLTLDDVVEAGILCPETLKLFSLVDQDALEEAVPGVAVMVMKLAKVVKEVGGKLIGIFLEGLVDRGPGRRPATAVSPSTT